MKKIIIWLMVTVILISFGIYLYSQSAPREDIEWYNQGVKQYSQGNWYQAQDWFKKVAYQSQDPKLRALALYNWGTMLGELALQEKSPLDQIGIMEAAIAKLKEAVQQNPDHEQAKYNLELLMNKHRELIQGLVGQGKEEDFPPRSGPQYSPGGGDKGY